LKLWILGCDVWSMGE